MLTDLGVICVWLAMSSAGALCLLAIGRLRAAEEQCESFEQSGSTLERAVLGGARWR